jgi:hypothetical protein
MQTAEKAPRIAWQTEVLRVTAFPISGATVVLPNSWKDITGNDPDETVTQPAPRQSFEAGPFFGGRLSVGHQPGRIDLVLMADQNNPPPAEFFHIGSFDIAIDHILPAARKMFRPDMVMQRLAIGAVLLDPVESTEDGYEVLKSILPIAREFPENARDFFLQLNVPVTISATDTLQMPINRLLKWHSARLQMMNMIGGSGVPTQIVGGTEIHVVRLEMDINTPADLPFALSFQNMLDLIDHLAAQARAITANAGWFPE